MKKNGSISLILTSLSLAANGVILWALCTQPLHNDYVHITITFFAVVTFLCLLWLGVCGNALLASGGKWHLNLFQNKKYPHVEVSLIFFSTALCIVALELLVMLCPMVLPPSVYNVYRSPLYESLKKPTFEILDESPYIKFKPNTVATSQGHQAYLGLNFVRKWKTDSLGFKNPPWVWNQRDEVKVLAIGDSFTEGMGVKMEQSWPYLLSPEFPSYNFGVQGYGLHQMIGCLRSYGKHFKPEYVVMAYLVTTYFREEAFAQGIVKQDPKAFFSQKQQVFNNHERIHELRRQSPSALAALVTACQFNLKSLKTTHPGTQVDHDSSERVQALPEGIKYQIKLLMDESLQKEKALKLSSENVAWTEALKMIEVFREETKKLDATPLFVLLPNAGESYYQRIFQKTLPPQTALLYEARLIQEHCEALGVHFINMIPVFTEAVTSQKSDYHEQEAFFLRDGHPSPRGQALIAEQVKATLKKLDSF